MSDNQDIERLKEASNINTLNETEKVSLKCSCGYKSNWETAPVGDYEAYDTYTIDWLGAIPQEGMEYHVIACFPFYGEIGQEFRVVYYNEEWADVDFTMCYSIVCCRLTGIESVELSEEEATIRILVTQVRYLSDYKQPCNPVYLKYEHGNPCLSEAESYVGNSVFGKHADPRLWDQNGCVFIHWNCQGDFGGRDLIYTDENGIDHLLACEEYSFHICKYHFRDSVLGDHEKRKQMIRAKMTKFQPHRGALCGSLYNRKESYGNVIMFYRSSAAYLWIDDLMDYLMCQEIGDDALECAAQEIVFERRIPPIGEHAFSRCTDLRKVTVLDECEFQLNEISPNAFKGCSDELVFSVPAGSGLIPLIQKMGFQIQERGLNERTEELLPPRPSLENEPEDSSDVPEDILSLASMPEDHLSLADEPYFDDMAEIIVQHEVKQRKKR